LAAKPTLDLPDLFLTVREFKQRCDEYVATAITMLEQNALIMEANRPIYDSVQRVLLGPLPLRRDQAILKARFQRCLTHQ
jgi:hypothetical protein